MSARDDAGWAGEVEAVRGLMEALPPGRVLDLSVQSGRLMRDLRGEVTTATADPGRPLEWPDGSFDRIVAAGLYGRLEEQAREPFLDEARRVATQLVLVEPADAGLAGAARSFGARELAAEVGGARVLHEDRWLVVVAAG